MVMTAVTVLVAFVNIGILNFPIALTIAIFKATLVVLFFMHAKYSSRLTKLVVGSAFFFLGDPAHVDDDRLHVARVVHVATRDDNGRNAAAGGAAGRTGSGW